MTFNEYRLVILSIRYPTLVDTLDPLHVVHKRLSNDKPYTPLGRVISLPVEEQVSSPEDYRALALSSHFWWSYNVPADFAQFLFQLDEFRKLFIMSVCRILLTPVTDNHNKYLFLLAGFSLLSFGYRLWTSIYSLKR